MQLLHVVNLPNTQCKPWRAVLALPISSLLLCSSMAWAAQTDPPPGVPGDLNRFLQFLNTSAPQFTDNIKPLFSLDKVTSLLNQTPVVEAYYKAIDPDSSKTTLAGFKKANGYFNAPIDALVVYVNDADLGFGRRMDVRTNPDKSIASCVANYGGNSVDAQGNPAPSVDDPDNDKIDNAAAGGLKGLIATVCMEYSGTPGAYVTAPPTLSLLAYNDDISRTNSSSAISQILQPGNYRVIAATYASGKRGSFSVKAVGYGLTLLNSSGSWTSSGGQSYTSTKNPSYPLTVTQAGTVTINLSSAVDTYLYLLKETSSAPNAQLSGPKFTKFYAYGADVNQTRLLFADLDGRGAKAVPGVCNVCHGGAPNQLENGVYPNNGNTNAQWLPWDLDNLTFDNRVGSQHTRAKQEWRFKILNQAVLATYPQSPTSVSWMGNVAIPDNDLNGVYIPLTVSGVKGPINQVIVSIDGDATTPGISHPNAGDLELLLVSPAGKQFISLASLGAPASANLDANFRNVYFSDDADTEWRSRRNKYLDPVQPEPKEYHGTFRADAGHLLSDVNGLDPNGTWQLRVRDRYAGTTGTVKQWSIHFNGTPDAAYLPAPVELIRGWYGGTSAANPMPNPTFNGRFVPKGWQVPAVVINGQSLNPSDLYLQVVAPGCRACHVQRGNMMRNEVDFASYDKFINIYGTQVASLVFDKGLMPLARRTYQNHFWAKDGSTSNPPAALLAKFLGVDINIRQPGFPVANAGPFLRDSAVPLGVSMKLNGKGSVFADGYKWSMTSPAGSKAVLTGEATATPVFTPDMEGDYNFSLVVNNAKGTSVASNTLVRALVLAAPSPVSFATHVYNNGQGCTISGCHFVNSEPHFVDQNGLPDKNIFYTRMIERIDINDLENSLVIRKMNGDVPHTGGKNDWYFLPRLLRWIYDGAPNN